MVDNADSVIVPLSVRMTSFAHDVTSDALECHLIGDRLMYQGQPVRIIIRTDHEVNESDIQSLFMRGDISLQCIDQRETPGFDIGTKLDAEDISLRLWSRITPEIVDDMKKCMFYNWEDKQIHGVITSSDQHGISVINIPSDKILFYEGERYNMKEFVTSHIDCYNGIVNQAGPNIVVNGNKRYVNRRKLADVTGIVEYPLDHSNVVESFVREAGQGNVPGLVTDTKYTEDEMYKLFTDFAFVNGMMQPPTKKPWRHAILSHIIDISAKSKNPEEARNNISPGRMVKATTSQPSTHICYYVFHKQTPDNIKIVKPKVNI